MSDMNKPEEATIFDARPKVLPQSTFRRHPAKQRLGRHDVDEAALLNELYQSLQRINEGMIRSNVALSELVDEVKLMRK